jgi:hypothetical protein
MGQAKGDLTMTEQETLPKRRGPVPQPDKKLITLGVSIPQETYKRIWALADEEKTSLAEIFRRLVQRGLD